MNVTNQVERLETISSTISSEFGDLNSEQLNFKPSPNQWSIGQIIEHLIIINSSYYPTFENISKGLNSVPFIGSLGFMVNFLGNLIHKSVKPENVKKSKTIEIWEPTKSEVPDSIVKDFIAKQLTFIGWLKKLDKPEYLKEVISSPANKYIVYTFGKAIEIIVDHEERHLNQALRVKSTLK